MVDMAVITGAVTSLKAAVDIAKTAKDMNDLTAVRGKVIEMQELILQAQSSAVVAQAQVLELLQETTELRAKVSKEVQWRAEAARYKLVDYGDGTFAYELKFESAEGEPAHRLCATCYSKGQKSILQFKHVTPLKQDMYQCVPCKRELAFGKKTPIEPRPNLSTPGSWMA